MRARVAIALAIVLGAGSARAQAPAPVPAGPLQVPPAPVAQTPSQATDPNAPSQATESPTAEAPVEPGADAAGMPTSDAAALSGEMTEAELLELGLGADQPVVDTSVRLSGFIDFGAQVGFSEIAKSVFNHRAFAIGNLNVYITKNITETVRTMAELRFMYLPNGASTGTFGGAATNTGTADYNDYGRTLYWGGVEIERVYLEWAAFQYLTIRAGQFLTPYGVWNVDHGTPTIIPAVKPYVIGIGFFPERQTGIELYGRTGVGNSSDIGYHLTLSNGTGTTAEWKELDRNKAIGARVFWEYRGLGELRLGASTYYGRDTTGTKQTTFGTSGITASVDIDSQYDSLALGLDAVWKYRGLQLQWEWGSSQNKYTKEGRVASVDMTGSSSFPIDSFNWGTYGLAGYRFDWLGVMPFVMYQYFTQQGLGSVKGYTFGVNVRPIDALALKVQYYRDFLSGQGAVPALFMQAAWAF